MLSRFAYRRAALVFAAMLGLHAGAAVSMSGESTMFEVAGTFEVKVTPQPADAVGAAAGIGRLALEKRFLGPLEATSRGEMLASGDGSRDGAYVAVETVDGCLDGRRGRFALVHHALMRDGTPEAWTVTVVPGSGTGELVGLSGSMRIDIADGVHHYTFRYTLGAGTDGDGG